MFRHGRNVLAIITAVSLRGAIAASATGQSEKSTSVLSATPEAEKTDIDKNLAAATEAAKQLLLAMDTNKSGKVSKEEWMKFMEAEFDRLDADHRGQLDVKELTPSRVRMRPYVGK
jgi:hypothetical protein